MNNQNGQLAAAQGQPQAQAQPQINYGATAKVPIPRILNKVETLDSLNTWKTCVRNYYIRDEHFKLFLQAGTTWNKSQPDSGFQRPEAAGLRRPAAQLAEDLEVFLNLIAGFLPFSFLKDRLEMDTRCIADVWNIIFELYGQEVTPETFLDYNDLPREDSETHRQYFERLSSHIRRHLAPANTQAAGMNAGANGDAMDITKANMIVAHWLKVTDPRLTKLVRHEYSAELKQGTQLITLMPRISKNIDTILAKADANINALTTNEEVINTVEAHINKLGYNKNTKKNPNKNFQKASKDFCHHCDLLNKRLKLSINVAHSPDTCFRQRAALRIVQEDGSDNDPGLVDSEEGQSQPSILLVQNSNPVFQRTNSDPIPDASAKEEPPDDYVNDNSVNFIKPSLSLHHGTQSPISDSISTLRSIKAWKEGSVLSKAASPSLSLLLDGIQHVAILDEGANHNCLDLQVAKNRKVRFSKTTLQAKSAGSNDITVAGICESDLIVSTLFQGESVDINLGRALVIPNLGIDFLIGEPAKQSNSLTTNPRTKTIVHNLQGRTLSKPYLSEGGYKAFSVCKPRSKIFLLQGESTEIPLPEKFLLMEMASFQPRGRFVENFKATVFKTQVGSLKIRNSSSQPVIINKGETFGDLRTLVETPISIDPPTDKAQLNRVNAVIDWSTDKLRFSDNREYVEEVDPEKLLKLVDLETNSTLSKTQAQQFRKIITKYAHIFTKQPGLYNGSFGEVDNSINFSELPPPPDKVYTPSYSQDMLDKMSAKMDQMERDGVLICPEKIGVSVAYVSPSLLLPKPDPNEHRYVNDFGGLNRYILKSPSVSPNMNEAKRAIASKPFRIDLDLSQYYYQAGVRAEDAQYLGVIHPSKGLRVYTRKPMGVKNASENCYELLARIFGDMCQQRKLTRMADGLHVLASSVEELAENFEEVLRRLETAGLTLKPTKIDIMPKQTNLFGWNLQGSEWTPTVHTTSALETAPRPKTVKQLRSFLGSLKQLSQGMERYAQVLKPLEMMIHAGGRDLNWSDEQNRAFEKARKMAASFTGIHTPRPEDKLVTYSDYSAEYRAIGGRLEIHRKNKDGSITILHGGHFSIVLDEAKRSWWPCEGEAAGIRLTLEHFAPWIRESKHPVTHYTDNQSCVLAWKRSLKGAYSTSSRIAAFLTGLSALSIELVHRPGKNMMNEDFVSRHPRPCLTQMCQLCKFGKEIAAIGDNCATLRSIEVKDILTGQVRMPFSQKKAWGDLQHNCQIHNTIRYLIKVGQRPDKHKTKGKQTYIKLLYNYFLDGRLFVDEDDIIMIRVPNGFFNGFAVSIPPAYMPGLLQSVHYKLQHPSKSQMLNLVSRYYFAIGLAKLVNDISENCYQCAALRPLPKAVTEHTTTVPQAFGSRFSADVIERESQRILLVRESLSQFTILKLIPNQMADTLTEATFEAILPLLSEEGAVLRVDGATAWQSISNNPTTSGPWAKYNVKVEVGSLINPNKNPEAEVAIKECEKEILKFNPDLKTISPLQLSQIMKQINTRVRNAKKFAPQEMMLRRELAANKKLDVDDTDLTEAIKTARQTAHDRVKPTEPDTSLKEGDLVLLKKDLSKHHARETHVIIDKTSDNVKVKKIHNQLRRRTYQTPPQTLVKIPQKLPDLPKPKMDIPDDSQKTNRAGRPMRRAAKTANRAWADINCLRCSTNHRVGWCPEDQREDTYEYFPIPSFPPLDQPLINPQPTEPTSVLDQHQSRSTTNSPRPTVITRTHSPTVITNANNPNFKTPVQRKSERIKLIPKPPYKDQL